MDQTVNVFFPENSEVNINNNNRHHHHHRHNHNQHHYHHHHHRPHPHHHHHRRRRPLHHHLSEMKRCRRGCCSFIRTHTVHVGIAKIERHMAEPAGRVSQGRVYQRGPCATRAQNAFSVVDKDVNQTTEVSLYSCNVKYISKKFYNMRNIVVNKMITIRVTTLEEDRRITMPEDDAAAAPSTRPRAHALAAPDWATSTPAASASTRSPPLARKAQCGEERRRV